jgi:hypothetical protein
MGVGAATAPPPVPPARAHACRPAPARGSHACGHRRDRPRLLDRALRRRPGRLHRARAARRAAPVRDAPLPPPSGARVRALARRGARVQQRGHRVHRRAAARGARPHGRAGRVDRDRRAVCRAPAPRGQGGEARRALERRRSGDAAPRGSLSPHPPPRRDRGAPCGSGIPRRARAPRRAAHAPRAAPQRGWALDHRGWPDHRGRGDGAVARRGPGPRAPECGCSSRWHGSKGSSPSSRGCAEPLPAPLAGLPPCYGAP